MPPSIAAGPSTGFVAFELPAFDTDSFDTAMALTRKYWKWSLPAFAFALYTALGFWVAPDLIRDAIIEQSRVYIGKSATVEAVRVNPLALSVELVGVDVKTRHAVDVLKFDSLYINFQTSSLFRWAAAFAEIRLTNPQLNIEISEKGRLNLQDLVAGAKPESEALPAADKDPFPVAIFGLQILNGKILFVNRAHADTYTETMAPINLTLTDFRTHIDEKAPHRFTAELDKSERIEWEGNISVFPPAGVGKISVSNISLHRLWRYYKHRLNFDLENILININTDYAFVLGEDGPDLQLDNGRIRLTGLDIREKRGNAPVLTVPETTISGLSFDLRKLKIAISDITTRDAVIHCRREKDGELNFVSLFSFNNRKPAASSKADDPGTEQTGNVTADTASESETAVTRTPADADPPPMPDLRIDALHVRNYRVHIADLKPPLQVAQELSSINADIRGYALAPGSRFSAHLEAVINNTGKIIASGSMIIDPLEGDFKIAAQDIPLAPFSGYLSEKTYMALDKGALGTTAAVRLKPAGDAVAFDIASDVTINGVSILDGQGKDLAGWDDLRIEGIDFQSSPMDLKIGRINWVQPKAHVVINEKNELNFGQLIRGEPGKADAKTPAPEVPEPEKDAAKPVPPAFALAAFELSNGKIHFTDQSLAPSFQNTIAISGRVEDLSSRADAIANIAFNGTVDTHAPVSINGKIAMQQPGRDTALNVELSKLDLTAMTPYSLKFIGFPIERGKLRYALDMRAENLHLEGLNRIEIDRMALGDFVPGPSVTNLPVKLALALMQDTDGNVQIDVPMAGDLNDPAFSFRDAVLTALQNLITKAAASPFEMLASIAGADMSLDRIAFVAGNSRLDEIEQHKIQALGQALLQKPQLGLEIKGIASPEIDGAVFRAAELSSELKRKWLAESIFRDKHTPLDQVKLPEADRRKMIQALYEEKIGSEPPSLEAAEGQLLDAISVSEGRLRQLARERAAHIKSALMAIGVAEERLYLNDSELAAGSGEKVAVRLNIIAL